MSGHTPGPLVHLPATYDAVITIVNPEGFTVCVASNKANAARLAACWNALEGMNPDAVEQLVEAARDAILALPVLVTMCKAAHLEQGACAAEAMLERTRTALTNIAGEAAQQEGNG